MYGTLDQNPDIGELTHIMPNSRIVFLSDLDPQLRDIVVAQSLPGMEVACASLSLDDDRKAALAADADFLILWPARISERVFRAAGRCKLVQLLSAGYDQVDLSLAKELGIPVANNGGANSVAVAEHTILLILACYRRLVRYANLVTGGGWRELQDRKPDVYELEGKTVGLIGFGNIARKVARMLKGFDARVQFFDKYATVSAQEEKELGVRPVSLEELLRTSDAVSIHVPLTAETRDMVGKAEFELMKTSAIIVNTSRGGIINEPALLEALNSGSIAGAGLDVLEHEPPDPNDPLLKADNLILTPHNAGPTMESLSKRAANAFQNIQRVIDGKEPLWAAVFENR